MNEETDNSPQRCPNCGSTDTNRVLYGLPAGPPQPGVTHGGCMIGPDGPDWICNHCDHEWQTPDSFRAKAWDEAISTDTRLR